MDPMTMMALFGMAQKGIGALAGGQQPQMQAPQAPQLMPIQGGMGTNLGALLDPFAPQKPNQGFGYGGY